MVKKDVFITKSNLKNIRYLVRVVIYSFLWCYITMDHWRGTPHHKQYPGHQRFIVIHIQCI